MNNLTLQLKNSVSIFLTQKMLDNGKMEEIANICLYPIRQKVVYLDNENRYFLYEYPSRFESEKVNRLFEVVKATLLFGTGIGIIGIGLKSIAWLNPEVREKNIRYIQQLRLEEEKKADPPFPVTIYHYKKKPLSFSLLDPLSKMSTDIQAHLISFLTVEEIKNLRLVSSNWYAACGSISDLYKRTLEERYPKEWIEKIGIEQLSSIPRIQPSSRIYFPVDQPIRCLGAKEMGSYAIVQGCKDHIPFLAIRYTTVQNLHKDRQTGVCVLWKPPVNSMNQENHSWIDAQAISDSLSLGTSFRHSSSEEMDKLILDCLATLLKNESYILPELEEDKPPVSIRLSC